MNKTYKIITISIMKIRYLDKKKKKMLQQFFTDLCETSKVGKKVLHCFTQCIKLLKSLCANKFYRKNNI